MKHGHAFKPSAAMVVAWIALSVALGGSAAAAGWRATLIASEPFHAVGAAGEPTFSNGGQGDCAWANADASTGQFDGLNPAAFYRANDGRVNLAGVVVQKDAGGGDGGCGVDDMAEDLVVFTLPQGYRPENIELLGGPEAGVIVVPDEGAVVGGEQIAPGSVLSLGRRLIALDGIGFRASGEGTTPIADSPAAVELSSLRELSALGD